MKYIKTYEMYGDVVRQVNNPTNTPDYEKHIRYTKTGRSIYSDDYFIGSSNDPETGVKYLFDILCVKKHKKWLTVGKKYKLWQQDTNKFMWIIDDRGQRYQIVTEKGNDIDFFISNKNDFLPYRKQDDKNLFTTDNTLKDYELRTTQNKFNL